MYQNMKAIKRTLGFLNIYFSCGSQEKTSTAGLCLHEILNIVMSLMMRKCEKFVN